MPASPINTLAHTLLPNLVKLKGHMAFVMAVERKDKPFFAQSWQQAYVEHDPKFFYLTKKNVDATVEYRIGIINLPEPKDMGDAYMLGCVTKRNDSAFGRLFLLERDWVMKTKQDKTTVTEREGAGNAGRRMVHFDGPAVTGAFEKDAQGFADAFMELLLPTKVTRK
jgi:hypothetical protein